MPQSEIDQRLQVLRQTLGQRVNPQDNYPIAVAEQHHGRNVAQPAQQFAGSEVKDTLEQPAQWNFYGQLRQRPFPLKGLSRDGRTALSAWQNSRSLAMSDCGVRVLPCGPTYFPGGVVRFELREAET
jgi:hypothetical protein